MLTEIEEKIVERLNLKIAEPKHVDIDEAHSALAVPSIDVVVGGGKFEKVSKHYKLTAKIFVVIAFQNLRSVRDRRNGVYPILESIAALLIGNSLGLKIAPIIPKRLDNITEEEEAADGKIVFQLEFETSFIIEKLSDEEIADLVTVGLGYLMLGNETASDTVTLDDI